MTDASTITIKSPAKINLWLRISGKRSDGLHLLETRFLPLQLHDTITLTKKISNSGTTCSISDPTIPSDGSNLAFRALTALAEIASVKVPDAHIHIEKRIPSGAGMGGGSSNAAAVLRNASEIFPELAVSPEARHKIAAQLGADVPFFLHSTPQDATGIGDVLTPAEFPHRLSLLLIKPAFGVSTPWAYRSLATASPPPDAPLVPQPTPWGTLENHLEAPVFSKHLFLAHIKSWLLAQQGVAAALMSGSGSTTFAILKPDTDAAALAETARLEFGTHTWIHATQTIAS